MTLTFCPESFRPRSFCQLVFKLTAPNYTVRLTPWFPNKSLIPKYALTDNFRCRRGFIGQYCEFQDPCLYRSCNEENGHGHCEPVKSSYGQKYEAKCHCEIGYGGLNCEKITRCQTTVSGRPPCENGGQCRTHPNQEYSCDCTDSFTGKF